jgi:competence protein ComEC
MAGLVLFGRLIGLSLEAWQVLSLAVIGLILIDPAIATSAGFQLSVAATAGVLIGARWPITGGGGARPLAVTLGAQVAVAPLLLLYFHRVPLLSPAINLVAAPVVTVATLLGSIGVAIVPGLIPPATFLADLTLSLANGVAGWPQIGALEVVVLMAVAVIVGRYPKLRAPAALAVSLAVVFVVVLPRGLPPNTVTVLDVGQGDAILISGGEGRYALVDGGPDPATLLNLLREHGVRHLDLVVLTHLHADHAKGLAGLVGRIGVDRVWADSRFHDTPASEEFFEAVSLAGIPVARPDIAETTRLGGVLIEVLAPSRRFASSNDQSIVLMVTGPRLKMLLSGDVEVTAQSELGVIKADVLKVPHHGGATSDPHWLEATGANLAVISVGDNGFGHPAPSILDLFSDLGTEVLRTDRDGDVVVPLG